MRIACAVGVVGLAVVVASAAPVPKGADKAVWVGKLAFPKDRETPITTRRADGSTTTAATGPLARLMVTKVVDEQVHVGYVARPGEAYYFLRKDVMPAKEAIDFYTAKLGDEANDDFALVHRARAYAEVGKFDLADADDGKLVAADKNNVLHRQQRILHRTLAKKFDAALEDVDVLIKAYPQQSETYIYLRADTLSAAKRHDEAVGEMTKLLATTQNRLGVLIKRGLLASQGGQYQKALEDYDTVIKENPNYPLGTNNKAWLLCTCPDDKIRDGKLAVELATSACQLTNWKNAGYIDTLAAAYAEAGDFDNAVKYQSQVIEDPELLRREGDEIKARLELYKQKKPYRLPTEKK